MLTGVDIPSTGCWQTTTAYRRASLSFVTNDPPVGISIDSATGKRDGRELTVSFGGSPDAGDKPCGADYTAEAVESAMAAVVIVTEHPHAFGETCSLVGALRTATVELAAPLRDRALLEVREGRPVPVVLTP